MAMPVFSTPQGVDRLLIELWDQIESIRDQRGELVAIELAQSALAVIKSEPEMKRKNQKEGPLWQA